MTLYSDLVYVVFMAIIGGLLLWWSIRKVISVTKGIDKRLEDGKEFKEGRIVRLVIFLIIAWAIYIALGMFAWKVKADMVKTRHHQNPAEEAEIEKILAHEPISEEDLTKNKEEFLEERDVKPFQKKLSAFDQKMKAEAEKIRKRNEVPEPGQKD